VDPGPDKGNPAPRSAVQPQPRNCSAGAPISSNWRRSSPRSADLVRAGGQQVALLAGVALEVEEQRGAAVMFVGRASVQRETAGWRSTGRPRGACGSRGDLGVIGTCFMNGAVTRSQP